jgi:aerobic carbon-monoxide dehydrogenase large subunit
MRHAATVMALASNELIACGKAMVAFLLDTPRSDISFIDGRFTAPGRNRSFDLFELAREAARVTLPADLQPGLAVAAENEMHDPVFPNGAAVCEVEIDPETGAFALTRYASVDDVGRCINPLIVDGQTHGAIAQGVGEALWEQIYLEPSSGQPLTGSFMDYALPRAADLPSFRTEIVEVLSPTNPYGIKAGGEGGTTPTLAVIVSAILDALAPLSVHDIPLPATSSAIWAAIQAAKAH